MDPLDGTKEFIKKNGEFTVNIGFVREGVTVLGVIYVPVSHGLYVGAEGIGAYKYTVQADEIPTLDQVIQDECKLLFKNDETSFIVVVSKSHLS